MCEADMEAHDCHFETPLHVACVREHLDCVKVLLNAGAKVNAAKLHETALHHAAKVKNVDLIKILIAFEGLPGQEALGLHEELQRPGQGL